MRSGPDLDLAGKNYNGNFKTASKHITKLFHEVVFYLEPCNM